MKIKNIFWLFTLKKNRRTLSLIIKVDKVKITNILIEEGLVLNHTLYKYILYNLAYKIKQYLNFYKYGQVLVYCKKNIKY